MNENFLPEAHLCSLMPFILQQHRFLFFVHYLYVRVTFRLQRSETINIPDETENHQWGWAWRHGPVILATCELKAGGQEKRSYKEMGRKARRSGALWIGDVEGCCNLSNTSSIAWMDPSLLCSPDESNRPEESPACTAFHTLWPFQY